MTWFQTPFNKLMAHMAELRGADFKIAFYLVSEVFRTGSVEISLSQRALSDATGLCKTTIQAALVRLEYVGLFLRDHGGRAQADRYLLPAFRVAESGPIYGTQVGQFPVQGGPENGTQVGQFPVQGGPENGTQVGQFPVQGGPENGTQVGQFPVQGGPENGTPEAKFPDAHNKERARAPVESSSFVGSSSSSIDRVLRTRTLRESQRDEAEVLRRYMRSFIERCADASLNGKPIDDAIVAQCLAIAPAGLLMKCLDEFRFRHVPPFQTLGWFVTAFLKYFMGVPPSEVKARRGALRVVRKPVNGETRDAEFTSELTSQLVSSAKGLG